MRTPPSPPPIVVAHSFGGLTGPLVGRRVGIGMLVMLAAMVPAVGARRPCPGAPGAG